MSHKWTDVTDLHVDKNTELCGKCGLLRILYKDETVGANRVKYVRPDSEGKVIVSYKTLSYMPRCSANWPVGWWPQGWDRVIK